MPLKPPPRPRAGSGQKVGTGIGQAGRVGSGRRGPPGLCFPVPGGKRAGQPPLPPRRAAAVLGPDPGGADACLPHPLVGPGGGRRPALSAKPLLPTGVSVSHTGALSAFATVDGRFEEQTVSSLIRSRKYIGTIASVLC